MKLPKELNMNFKKGFNLFFFLLIIFSSTMVLAEPPFQTSGGLTNELIIVYPKEDSFDVNENITLHFHVFNSTGALVNNTLVTCNIHIYGHKGEHIIRQELEKSSDGIELEILLTPSNLTGVGDYGYTAWCNNTQDGFISGSINVNNGGNNSENLNNSFTGMFLLLGMGLIAFISLTSGSAIKDKKLDGIKLFLWGFGLLHIMFISGILMLQSLYNTDIANLLRYNSFFITYFTIITFSILYIVYTYIGYVFIDNVTDNNYGEKK